VDLNLLVDNFALYLLVFARIITLFLVAPFFSSPSIPPLARVVLAFFTAAAVAPGVIGQGSFVLPPTGGEYFFLITGEVMIGLLLGLMLQLLFAAVQTAGQLFSIQMGFGASEVFDPLAEIEIPIMGQFLNLVALYVFIAVGSIQKVFLYGISRSFFALSAPALMQRTEFMAEFFIRSLAGLFEQALIIAFPMVGTLFLLSVALGLIAKAAPQMNLMMVGFPVQIAVGFLVLFFALPYMIDRIIWLIQMNFDGMLRFMDTIWKGAS
jgi:flagellar biosynthetic protein FliR